MAQELTYKNIAVAGCGAAGAMAALLLVKNPDNKVTAFDLNEPFSTLLPTGGGRCNITYDEDDIKEFVKNYPRGEKFLLSVFSKFDSVKTRCLFDDLGIKTYVQEDKRVFPISNSALKTVEKLRKHLNVSNFIHRKEKVLAVEKNSNKFIIKTDKNSYCFDNVIIASGGRGNGFELAKSLGHNVISPRPSLCALDIKESYLYNLAGVCLKGVEASIIINKRKKTCYGDILFTHKSISGPCIFKISALSAFEDFDTNNPLEFILKVTTYNRDEIEIDIKNNLKKTLKNVFSKYAPESFITEIMKANKIQPDKQTAQMNKKEKEILINSLLNLRLHAAGRIKNSEIVTAGGVDLNEINPKTMESKIVSGLYFIGEILNIDGFTGGFNLQNCWSGAYICSINII